MSRLIMPASHRSDPLSALGRLTLRDQVLLSWLAEHYVLTTEQITTALFTSRRSAQRRLMTLHRIGAVSRFRYQSIDVHRVDYRAAAHTHFGAHHGSSSYRYTLGPLGTLLHPTTFIDPDDTNASAPRTHLERCVRIARSRQLPRLLAVNQFFVDLCAHARTHPDTALQRWWSGHHATHAFAADTSQIRPDAHGVWQAGSRPVGFFLQHDDGGDLRQVMRVLRQYERLAFDDGGPRYPVLFTVASRQRRIELLQAIANAGLRLPFVVAAAVRDDAPAGPVWGVPRAPSLGFRLRDMPCSPVADRP